MAGRTTYVWCDVEKCFVEKHKRMPENHSAMVNGKFETFQSPIDQSEITGPASLREHNRRHGVTDSRDYSPEFMEKKQKERLSPLNGNVAKQERKAALRDTMRRMGY